MTKPTQVQDMIDWFQRHGYKATLGEILQSGERWSYEFRARLVDARTKYGYSHTCEKGETPAKNVYRIMPPDGNQMRLAV